MHGWTGNILHIDMTTRASYVERPPREIYEQWLGGRGLAGYFYAPYAHLDWDAPEMPLILMTGPLTGTQIPSSDQVCILSRSPLTGTVGDVLATGTLGMQMKRAGYDGIILTGKYRTLQHIEIHDEAVLFHEAPFPKHGDTSLIWALLKKKGAVLSTGQAADHGVRFANFIVDEGNAIGRNGIGLVFASKGVKCLSVRGTWPIAIASEHDTKRACEDIIRMIDSSPVLMGEQGFHSYGSGALYDLTASRRMMPTANFRRTWFEHAATMNASAYHTAYETNGVGCPACNVHCVQTMIGILPVPGFDAMSHFSALLENTDIEIVFRANTLCNRYGMDPVAAASTLACYSELEGRRLDADEILSLLEDMATERGVGAELAQGSKALAEKRGRPALSMNVKAMDIPAYDPRGAYGLALSYAVSTHGADYMRANAISHEILRKPVPTDRFTFTGKARIIKGDEDRVAASDSLTACPNIFIASSLEEYAKALTAVTGLEKTPHELGCIGEKIAYRERIFNARNGFSAQHDDLPERFFTEAGSSGNGIEVPPLKRSEFLAARQNYYRVRGLDTNGRPTPEKALSLGLDWTE